MARHVKRFHARGMNVLTPAARAHERSGGDYIGMGWPERLDVVAWIGRVVQADLELYWNTVDDFLDKNF